MNVRWDYDSAPDPWRLYPDTDASPLRTFPGNPSHTTEVDADAELAALLALGVGPWIVVVKLYGEADTLHARAYLDSPPAGFEATSTSTLPEGIRSAMSSVPANGGCAVVRYDRCSVPRDPKLMDRILGALGRGPNVLLVGPPGTGKTVALEDLRAQFEGGSDGVLFDPDVVHDAWSDAPPLTPRGLVRTIVFHPSYSYEEFVIGLYPKAATGGIDLEARPGPLLSLAHWASEPGRSALLVADEFNRGNAAAIFGDTLAVLDKEKRSDAAAGLRGASIDRPYPDTTVSVAPDFANSAGVAIPPTLTLPSSLWIVAAMNSSDRSVAPLDAALRRRFSIVRVDPDYEVLAHRYGVPSVSPARPDDPTAWTVDDVLGLALDLLRSLNDKIELILGPDFLLGHALLWDVAGSTPDEAIRSLAAVFDERVVASLRMTFADQDDSLGVLLGVGTAPATTPSAASTPKLAEWVMPPPGLTAVASARLRLRPVEAMGWVDAAKAFRDLV